MKKLHPVWILFLLIMMCGNAMGQEGNWSSYAANWFADGTGTFGDPYVISTPEQLAFLAKQVNSGVTYDGRYIELDADLADLDLGAHYWTPIGTNLRPFHGTFNGNGKTIKNIIVRGAIYSGLFGVIQSGFIHDLNIVDCDVQGNANVGGLVGKIMAGGSIEMCSITGTVCGNGDCIGGLVGEAWCSISDCHSAVDVIGSNMVGGLAGFVDGSISGCSATGNVRGLFDCVGGLVGYMEWSTMTDCYATGSVTGYRMVGGLVGATTETSAITGCFAAGSVTGVVPLFGLSEDIGGLLGILDAESSVEECFASGAVTGGVNVGGLIGRSAYSKHIRDCYAVGVVTGVTVVGGFIGEDDTQEEFFNCYAAGAVAGTTNCGGFSGITATFYEHSYACFDHQATGTLRGTGIDNDALFCESFTTTSLTDGTLPGSFGISVIWQATKEGYYPQLWRFANHDKELIRQWSALSVTPLFLDNKEEFCSDVKTQFSLVRETASGTPITWSISPDYINSVDNYRVTCGNKGEWNRLTLTSGECSREIAFRSVNGFSEADLYAFVVDGKSYEPEENIPTRIVIDCESTDYETLVRLEMSAFATASTGNIITVKTDKPAFIKYDIKITSVDGGNPKEYTLEVEKRFSPDIFVQRWADVLAINNNSATNGGYTFTDYQWYRNGAPISGATKGYIQELGGLSKSADYTVVLTTQLHDEISTCPAEITNTTAKAAVYPNPVLHGQSVRFEIGMGRDGACPVSTMQLFDATGNIVAKQTIHDPVAEIAMPDTPGQYIMQVTVNGVAETFKIVVE